MHIAIDVGGTFTDIVVRFPDGNIAGYKSPSTRPDITEGVFNGIALVGQDLGLDPAETLNRIERIDFGTTVATNAILEGKTARTGLIVTRGFRDTLLIREGGKEDSYNIGLEYPAPYVPRSLTFEVDERVLAEGEVHRALDEEGVVGAIRSLKHKGVGSIAVSLLWSIANPAHEIRIGELIRERWPEIPFSLSHRVAPSIREYRRTIATAIDASLKPIVEKNVQHMIDKLAQANFRGALSYITSNGGKAQPQDIIERPVYLCLSGPSAAPEAGRFFAASEGIGGGNIITVDMGGTSFDVSIVTDNKLPIHREGAIDGHLFGVPSVEVHTIGSGGGSIARLDMGGMVHVGPESAGAFPGPACYDRGGERTTVTDSNLICGYLNETFSAGGGMTLRKDLAIAAMNRDIAEGLKLAPQEAAGLVALSCEQDMVVAIEDITIKRGIDPREYVLVAGGAAAGVHAVSIAREIGIKQVIMPRFGGVLSAFGILTGDVSLGFGRSHFTSTAGFDHKGVSDVLDTLARDGEGFLDRMEIPAESRVLSFTCEARYRGQVWQLTLPFERSHLEGSDGSVLAERFHAQHEALYMVRDADEIIEFTEWNLRAIGRLAKRGLPDLEPAERVERDQEFRDVFFREVGEPVRTPIAGPGDLRIGQPVEGPLVIDERLTTIVVGPNATVTLTAKGNYVVDLRHD